MLEANKLEIVTLRHCRASCNFLVNYILRLEFQPLRGLILGIRYARNVFKKHVD